jgi:lysophospholipase
MQEFSNAIADGSGEGLHSDLIMPNILCLMSKHNMKTPFTSFANINVQAVDYDNRTVLHIAAREGALEIAQWILQQGGVNVINE